MGFWTNHRQRQAGKYAKAAYRQQQMLPPTQPAMSFQVPAQPYLEVQTQPAGGFKEGYERGWREGQRDLVAAIRSGRLTWDEAVQRLG